MSPDPADEGAFGSDFERLDRIDSTRLFDPGTDGRPGLGGTTSLLYDTRYGPSARGAPLTRRHPSQLRRGAHALGHLDHL